MGWYKYKPIKNIKDVLEEKGKIKRSKGIEEYLKKEGVKFKTDKNYVYRESK